MYILGQNISKKSGKKNFELHHVFMNNFQWQNDKIFTNIFDLCQVFMYKFFVAKCFNTSMLCTTDALKALRCKNSFYFFFYHLLPCKKSIIFCHALSTNSSFNSFLSALQFWNLKCKAKSLTILFIYTHYLQAQNFLIN